MCWLAKDKLSSDSPWLGGQNILRNKPNYTISKDWSK
jgi:hypothetical protein